MTWWTHFVHKFKNSTAFLPISHNKRIKDIFFERLGIVLVHYMTTYEKAYMFTICVEYSKSPFDLTVFLKSLENLAYKRLMKDIKDSVDKKKWVNKEGLPLNARSMALKVRQTIISLDVMMATIKSIAKKKRAIELTGHVISQGGSIGSALPHAPTSGAQGATSTRSQVIIPSSSKRQKPREVPSQSKRMWISRPAEDSTAFVVKEIPSELEPEEKTNYKETKTMYEKF